MFYSPAILAKKGELSSIWLAAHWQNKVSKQQAMAVNIAESCQAIKQPTVPLALRLSGQLLHGVAFIHQKKVTYLSDDCSDALLKIKMAFRPGVVNLSAQTAAATPSKINAPTMSSNDDSMPSPMVGTTSKNKFAGMEMDVDVDDWTNLTPVHLRTTKKRLIKPSPTYDDSDARSTASVNDREEQWSEFPFTSDEASSVELVRKADDSKSMSSEQQQGSVQYQPYDYEDVNAVGDDDFRPSTGGAMDYSNHDASGYDDGLMLSGQNQSWLDDVAMRDNEEENENNFQKDKKIEKKQQRKDRKAAPASAAKRRKKSEEVTELSNEVIQNALQDVSDITVERANPREKGEHEDELRERGFPVRIAQTSFDVGMEAPAMSGFHPKLVQMFKQNAKAVPSFSGEKETSFEGEDVEIARAATVTTGTDDMGGYTGPDDAPTFAYDDVNAIGDDSFRQDPAAGDQTDLSASRGGMDDGPDELELTFQEGDAESPSRSGRASGTTPSSARRSATSSQIMVGETEKWNPQTIRVMKLLREKLSDTPQITYQDLAKDQRRAIVAKAFFEVLTLATRDMIAVKQTEPFGEITITGGRKYETLLPGE